MSLIVHNIKELHGILSTEVSCLKGDQMSNVDRIDNAFLVEKDGLIAEFGQLGAGGLKDLAARYPEAKILDAANGLVLPSFADAHTHLVFASSRELEYVDKIKGLSYEEIAKRGGGILNSARAMQIADEQQLFEEALERLSEIAKMGTASVEIKSGYGLTTESELKMLRVIRRLKSVSPLAIKASFLGAHAVPLAFKGRQSEYVDLVINEMIPMVAAEELADFVDVFCDRGFFTVEDTDRILNAGMKYGLRAKIHANELDYSGGIQVGVKYNAVSVDHLEFTGPGEIESLRSGETMPLILPGAAFFLNMQLSPARKMIQAGLPVAMASDFNPGSSPSGNMQLILSMASILYRLTPEEGLNATTINGAAAMDLSTETGSITIGKRADFYITKPMPGLAYMPYYYGVNKVLKAFVNGIEQ